MRVLLIDDSAEDREVIGKLLYYNGFDVTYASNGQEGLEVARRERPDCILVDLDLPRMSGLGLYATLKADPTTNAIPTLATTAHPERDYGSLARRAGCGGYLEKPVRAQHLVLEIERLVSLTMRRTQSKQRPEA